MGQGVTYLDAAKRPSTSEKKGRSSFASHRKQKRLRRSFSREASGGKRFERKTASEASS